MINKFYAIKTDFDEIVIGSISDRAREAKNKLEQVYDWYGFVWKDYYQLGFRCVKIEIKELEK